MSPVDFCLISWADAAGIKRSLIANDAHFHVIVAKNPIN